MHSVGDDMTFFQHLELFGIDFIGAALITATAYAILRLPWSIHETEMVWSSLRQKLTAFFLLPPPQPSPVTPSTQVNQAERRWIPIKVVQSC